MKKGLILLSLGITAATSLFSLSAWSFGETVNAADAADLLSRVSSGGVDASYDAALILQYTVGLIDRFPIEESPVIPTPEATKRQLPAETLELASTHVPTASPEPALTAAPAAEKTEPTATPHIHTWVTEAVPEVGHYESRLTGYEDGDPIYEIESVWIGSASVCNVCGAEYTHAGGISDHFLETGHSGYHAKDLYETHEVITGYKQVPVYADVWIVDIPTSTRTYCSGCGEEK